jgi:hypothetical protein
MGSFKGRAAVAPLKTSPEATARVSWPPLARASQLETS